MFRTTIGLGLFVLAAPALAAELSYNIIQAGYERIETDGTSPGIEPDGDGFSLGGSFEIGENWFAGAGYSRLGVDFGSGSDVDVDELSIGLGLHAPLNENVDFVATVQYLRREVSESAVGPIKEDGYGATIGVRGLIGDRFELEGGVGYADYGGGADGGSFYGGALYRFTESFGVGFDVGVDEDTQSLGLFGRFYF